MVSSRRCWWYWCWLYRLSTRYIAGPTATDKQLWQVMEQVARADKVRGFSAGLTTAVGQRTALLLAHEVTALRRTDRVLGMEPY